MKRFHIFIATDYDALLYLYILVRLSASRDAKPILQEGRLLCGVRASLHYKIHPCHYFSIASEVKSEVSKIVRHSAYSIKTMDSDIALIKLAKPVTFTKYIQPICLPNRHLEEPVGQKCFISGWGKLGERNATSNILQVAQVSTKAGAGASENSD